MNVLTRKIKSRTHFWNGTGWCLDTKRARIYNDHDARQAHRAMTLDSVMCDIRRIKKRI